MLTARTLEPVVDKEHLGGDDEDKEDEPERRRDRKGVDGDDGDEQQDKDEHVAIVEHGRRHLHTKTMNSCAGEPTPPAG